MSFLIEKNILEKYYEEPGITEIHIPEEVEKIKYCAFENCTLLQSVLLPESLTEIGSSAFKGCTSLHSVLLPANLTEIGYRAFEDCTSLQSVLLPANLTEISDCAFKNCISLRSIHIPNKVKFIGADAFRNCKELRDITFAGAPKTIGMFAFYGCWNLNRIQGENKNKAAEYVKDFMKRMQAGEMTIEEGGTLYKLSKSKGSVAVKEFSNIVCHHHPQEGNICTFTYEFNKYSANEHFVVFPTKIGKAKVSRVVCKNIPDDATVYCGGDYYDKLNRTSRALTAVEWLCENKMVRKDASPKIQAFIKKYSDDVARALQGCDEVAAFERFIQIAKPKALLLEKMIEDAQGKPEIIAILLDAKNNNSEKTKTDSKLSLDDIPKMTVKELSKLWTYHPGKVESGETYIEITNYKGHEKHVVIPEFIGKRRVYRISGVFPEWVESVEIQWNDIEIECSFRNCTAMADKDGFIAVDVGNRKVLTDYIGPEDAEILTIPEGITENRSGAFKNAKKVRKIVFPKSYKIVSYLSGCSQLQEAVLNDGLEIIGQMAFMGCKILKKIYIPESVNKIGGAALDKSTTIYGKSDSFIKEYADAYKMDFVEGKPESLDLSQDFFVDDGVLTRYFGKKAEVVIPENVVVIGSSVFEKNHSIKSVVIPNGVKKINVSAFNNCIKLSEVSFPETVENIDGFAFNDTNLKKIAFFDGIKTIGDYAFFNCCHLEEVHLPASLINIGDKAFGYIIKRAELTIYAPAGSYAETYAKENNIPFIAE